MIPEILFAISMIFLGLVPMRSRFKDLLIFFQSLFMLFLLWHIVFGIFPDYGLLLFSVSSLISSATLIFTRRNLKGLAGILSAFLILVITIPVFLPGDLFYSISLVAVSYILSILASSFYLLLFLVLCRNIILH